MTVTIQLSDEKATALQAQAASEGLTIAAWVQQLAEQHAQALPHRPQKQDDRPIWDVIAENMKDVPASEFEKLPRDGASEHDHYLYGHPKRSQ